MKSTAQLIAKLNQNNLLMVLIKRRNNFSILRTILL
jgi:hypothetical protein